MKILFIILGLVSQIGFAGGEPVLKYCPELKDCPIIETECPDKVCPDCPKCLECPPHKVIIRKEKIPCPVVKPKVCPIVKPKVVTKIQKVFIEKDKIVEKIVEKEVLKAPKNTLTLVGGQGPDGIIKRIYRTRERDSEYVFKRGYGALLGIRYERKLTPTWSLSGEYLSNDTKLVGIGLSW